MKYSSNLKLRRWPVLAVAAAFAVACGSSGGGGGSGDVDDDVVSILPLYAYHLTSTSNDPITVTLPVLPGAGLSVRLGHLFEGPGMFGEFHPASGTFTVFSGSSLVIDELAAAPVLYGDFSVEAIVDWFVPPDSHPETGALVVARGNERIEVAVIEGGDVVRIRRDAAGDGAYEEEAVFTWNEFEDLGDSEEVPEWQMLGSFGYAATIEFMLELAETGIEGLWLIDDDLEQGGQRITNCDAFSAAGLSVPAPPPDFPDRGTLTFAWLDDSADGSVGPGDSFVMDFDYCLSNDPDDDIDDLLNGTVGLNGYTEVVETLATGNFITRIGFEDVSASGRPGGLAFDALERWEVFDTDGSGPGTATEADLNAVINGRMTLVFFEPVN